MNKFLIDFLSLAPEVGIFSKIHCSRKALSIYREKLKKLSVNSKEDVLYAYEFLERFRHLEKMSGHKKFALDFLDRYLKGEIEKVNIFLENKAKLKNNFFLYEMCDHLDSVSKFILSIRNGEKTISPDFLKDRKKELEDLIKRLTVEGFKREDDLRIFQKNKLFYVYNKIFPDKDVPLFRHEKSVV